MEVYLVVKFPYPEFEFTFNKRVCGTFLSKDAAEKYKEEMTNKWVNKDGTAYIDIVPLKVN
ncbi:hypothetical protein [Bacillus sp. FDAARGOS_1420]|uniref:hypothetical protein n=1 Tax=unclassified Bacillus (in: firmicutes) TaxID=185979 RepID=UPI001C5B8BF1|nr:hypothetical protein [Bacillus sp. FDAARGOS_1420]MBW3493241.1 hypothetical protein [Bacillus sp. FDAARGOS_1420]